MGQVSPELAALVARLTPQQQEIFLTILANARDEESLNRELRRHPDLLNSLQGAVLSGIRADTFDLQAIFQELNQPARSLQELPHRIELCRVALAAVHREENAELWSALHNELATSLAQSPQGSRAENLEQAIAHYEQVLIVRTREAFPIDWAATHNNLANVYCDRTLGEREDNFEQAIAHYEQALIVRTREADSPRWAMTQHNLATAYAGRIRGERAENLEQAIAHFNQALEVYSHEVFPADWARTQDNLANAYAQRIRGERTGNLEEAIARYEQVLEFYMREADPADLARILHNLGNIYRDRISGERAENLEQAIAHYEQALTVYARETDPAGWAATHNNLANVYRDRILGERAENLEQAIAHYEQALTVYAREAFPTEWAATHNNLANVYRDRILGERAENLEQAIAHYEQALTVYAREAFPTEWAATQNNLALTYIDRTRGERAENLEQAITYAKHALIVRTRKADPADWAATQNNLALAYTQRVRGEREENFEQAIAHYEQALIVRTREADSPRWAMTQHNLANAYTQRIRGERAENLEQAIKHFNQALEVYTLQQFPAHFQLAQRDLGDLHFGEASWDAALVAYLEAIRAGQVLLHGAFTETGRQLEVARTSGLYSCSAYALLKLGRVDEALLQLEYGKTRLLSQALALDQVDINALSDLQQELLSRLRQTIRVLETEMRLPPATPARREDRALAEKLNRARADLRETLARIRTSRPDFMPEALELSEILALIHPSAALVTPIITPQGSVVFVVPSGLQSVSLEHVLWMDDFKEADLQALLRGRAEPGQLGGWLGAYFNGRMNSKVWFDTIEATGKTLWTHLMAPIAERLAALKVTQVLLMPQGGLGLLPLHAACYEVDGTRRYFADDYTVTYLPSAYAHKVSLDRTSDPHRHRRSLVAIINPTEDLPFTPVEGEQIASLFEKGKATVLPGAKATEERVLKQVMAGYVHFSCHGFYQWDDPMQSGLVLANGEPLTLAQIIGQLNMGKTRLVTLSACETGMTDIRQSPDEYLGLPAGFLQAGTPAVVSTLWAVNDLSTMLLMERFYHLHLQKQMAIPDALRRAQIWLREVTAGELAQRFAGEEEALLSSTRMSIESASDYFARFTKLDPKQQPFAHPYYWAAFTFSGA